MVRVHALSAQGPGESAVRMESDDAGLQSQTGVEPGELREIDAISRSKSAAKGLNRGGPALFTFVAPINLGDGYPHGPNLWKAKTGDPNFRTAGESFFAHSARLFTRPRDLLGGFINLCRKRLNPISESSPDPDSNRDIRLTPTRTTI